MIMAVGMAVTVVGSALVGTLRWTAVLLPVIWAMQAVGLMGIVWFISLLNVIFRDIQNFLTPILMMMLIISPIAYTPEIVPQSLKPLILLNPGAQYGAAKCWLPESFAQLADRMTDELGATVLLSAAPKERPIVEAIQRHMRHAAVDLSNKGLSLGALKEIVRRCDLMVTNDTGPRHIAAAFDVPVVTIFGPTHPQWTEIYYPKERQVAVKVFCGPCQKKTCPLDHRCMTRVTPGMVFEAAVGLLKQNREMGVGAV
jgi:ADP-heptose:LPS heptosyltransferase